LYSGDSCGKVFGCIDDVISGSDGGHGHGVMLEMEGVGESFATCALHDCANAAVMFE